MTGDAEELIVRRVIPISRERVFAAWLDPDRLARFMRPGATTGTTAEVDARVGGKFRIVMEHSGAGAEHRGEYLAIDPPSLLSFTWTSAATDDTPTIVTVELHGCPAGPRSWCASPPAVATFDAHQKGWGDIVRKLDEIFERMRRAGTRVGRLGSSAPSR